MKTEQEKIIAIADAFCIDLETAKDYMARMQWREGRPIIKQVDWDSLMEMPFRKEIAIFRHKHDGKSPATIQDARDFYSQHFDEFIFITDKSNLRGF